MLKDIFRYLKFERHLFRKNNCLPIYLIFFITNRCINNCRHCFVTKKKSNESELSLREIDKISKSLDDLLFFSPTGGEPFLRKDIDKIVKIFYDNNNARNIGIPTSGFNPDLIFKKVINILNICPDLELNIEVSVDGFKRTHNFVRNNNYSYQNAIKTLQKLKSISEKNKKLNLSFSSTFSKYNEDEILDLYKFITKRYKITNFTLLLTRGRVKDFKALDYNIEKYKLIKDIVNKDLKNKNIGYKGYKFSKFINNKRIIRNNIIYNIIKFKKRPGPCYAGSLAGVINYKGDVFPCEMKDISFGNLVKENYSMKKIWFGKTAKTFRKKMNINKCFCTHECFLSVNILFNFKYLFKLIFNRFK
jgi:Fe-coproporphyrin III synthase